MLKGGEYYLTEPLFIRPEDAGTAASPTVVEAAPGEDPVISGGMQVKGWKKVQGNIPGLPAIAKGKIYETDAPFISGRPLYFRQLWVNNNKAIRARDIADEDHMNRILSIDKDRQEIWIPAGAGVQLPAGPGQMEMIIHQMWALAVLRIKEVERVGDRYRLRFWEPESHLEFEHPWPAPVVDSGHLQNGNSAYYLSNSLSLLDSPGEWYEDIGTGKIYYWPRPGEDLKTSVVTVPALTQLVQIIGTADRPVNHIQWKGVRFAYSTWMRPSEAGHVPLQAGMYLLDAYKLKVPGTPDKKGLENQAWIGRPPGAVEVAYADHVVFQGCRFEHIASTGIDLIRGTHSDTIDHCRFDDIGGTGIQMGVYSDEAFETHLPYDPADQREVVHDEWITNNLVTDCANEDWGCVGISAGYVRGVNIVHNEVSEVSYSGICVGWGWTRTVNCMRDNHIIGNYVHHYAKHMYDVGGIYTLSAQPGTMITENRIDSIYHPGYVHDPKHWFYFYFDEGSSYITIRNNWCPGEKFMRNANGPGNTWENNGPFVDGKIKLSAGIKKQ
ncbi:MAG TPA: right-handed parallel beta-helix repeat-containing protein [Puia sp.]|nr:right-handed parallel beta-helix repeat-containing protein [Puia sp.]